MGEGEADLLSAVADAPWKATAYIRPHEFILEFQRPALVRRMKAFLVGDRGYSAKFLGRTYRYADLGGWRYWVVGNVLNRARLDDGGLQPIRDGSPSDGPITAPQGAAARDPMADGPPTPPGTGPHPRPTAPPCPPGEDGDRGR